MAKSLFAWLCALLSLAACAAGTPAAPAATTAAPAARTTHSMNLNEISAFASGGKPSVVFVPSRPHEQISARRAGNTAELTVSINVPRGGIGSYYSETRPLSAGEWDALEAKVERLGLLEFTPHLSGPVMDFGTYGFALDGTRANRQQWDAPLDNAAAPHALFARLGQLAHDKFSGLTLYYLIP